MAKYNYHVQIPTHIFQAHLDRLEKQAIEKIRTDFDMNSHLANVGRLKMIEELRNLPETLMTIQEHDDATA